MLSTRNTWSPGVNDTRTKLRAIAQTLSPELWEKLGQGIQWVESLLQRTRFFIAFHAKDKEIIRFMLHAAVFPLNRIEKVITMINLVTAKSNPKHVRTLTNPGHY